MKYYIFTFLVFNCLLSQSNHKDLINKIDKYVESIQSMKSEDSTQLKIYVRLSNSDSLIRITDTTNWLENIETTYNIIFDENGNPLKFGEYPYSESGDWDLKLEHFFDQDGNTIYFKYYLGFFNSICTEILRESKMYYFETPFALIYQKNEFRDREGQPIDTTGCIFNYNFEYKYYKNYEELIKQLGPFPNNIK